MAHQLTAQVLRVITGSVLAVLFFTLGPLRVFAQMAGHNHEPRNSSEPFVVGDQVTSIPYFTLRDGLSSQLTLFNAAPGTTLVTLTLFNPEGKPYSPPPIVLDAHSFKVMDLKDVVPDRDFDSGSIELAFRGINMTAVTTQVSIYSVEKRVLVESRHLHMFMSSNLNGIAWLPDGQADGYLAVTNTSTTRRNIDLVVGSTKKEIVLFGHQSRLIKLNDELRLRADSPSLISLHHDGLPGDVIAGGFVLGLKKGYSATIPMIDSGVMRSSHLAGAHVRFGRPDEREGFPETTRFFAPLLLANVGQAPVNADVSMDYTVLGPKQDGRNEDKKKGPGNTDKVSTVAVKHLTIRPGEVERIELSRELPPLGFTGPVKEAGVDIAYDAPPGTVIGQLTNVDESGDYSFEVPLKDPSAMDMMMEGGYPWTIEGGKNTTVYVKNTTDKPVRAYAVVEFPDGTSYTPPMFDLEPYQTFAVDVRKLKDSGQSDVWGKAFPADANHGLFIWRQQTPYTIIGRAETVNLRDGVASSFTCGFGCCVQAEEDWYFNPDTYEGSVGTSIPITGTHEVVDCYSHDFQYPDSMGSWTTSDSNVAYSNGSGYAVLVGAGGAGISTFLTIAEYEYDNENYSCDSGYYYASRYAQVTVNCGDARDDIRAEYSAYSVNLNPACGDFTQSAHSAYFQASELDKGDYSWYLVRLPLTVAASNGYGLDKWRVNYGSARTVTSAYRNPAHNANLSPPGAAQSRHMYGDAVDLFNASSTQQEWDNMVSAAGSSSQGTGAKADFVEPQSGPCGTTCTHADWRDTDWPGNFQQ